MNEPAIRIHGWQTSPVTFVDEVLRGLAARPKRIAPKYFYDERGSRLFDAICELPEYYPTRTEMAILEPCAAEVARLAGPDCTLIELGSGASRKIRLLLETLRPRHYIGVDISREFLIESVRKLASDYPWLEVHAACGDFSQALGWPDVAASGRRLLFFPGSTIGNFEPYEALAFLQRARRLLHPDGAVLVGVDLKKDPHMLHDAYNDRQGVTAAFNLNLLERLRRELGAELDPDGFRHRAFYNAAHGRIEMHLVSRRAQDIRLLGRRFAFERGESVHTENSYKYTADEFRALARRAGLWPVRIWCDAAQLFSVHYLGIAPTAAAAPARPPRS